MNKITKKIASVGVSLTTVIWLSGATMLVPVASAATTDELQAQITALLAQITALQAQLSTAQGTTTSSSYNFTKNLTLGSKGDDVMALQKFLNGAGYAVAASGAGSPGNETSYFGPATKAALAKYQAAKSISPAVGYFGPLTRASVNTATGTTTGGTTTGGTTTGGTVTVPSGFSIALASDNPAGTTLPKGANGVSVLKFTVSGTGTVDTLTFKRVGIGAAGDFTSSGFFVYEGASRLTSGKTINSTTHEIQFASLALKVEGSRTFTLVTSIASGATASNISSFNLATATGSPTPTLGTVNGNSFTVGGQLVGGVEIARGAVPTNPKIGQVGAKLSEFTLTASSTEDVSISKIALTEGGNITNDYVTNFVLKQGGNTLATADKIGTKDLVTFVLATPFKVEKGQQRTFEVYGDLGGLARADDTVGFYLDNISDISGKGALYGYEIAPNISTGFDAFADTGISLTVQGGQITITFNGPVAGDLALRGQDVTIFDFSIASQNNIEIKQLNIGASTTAMQSGDGFNDFKIWDVTSNAVLTSATDITTSTTITITDTININANQTRRFKATVDVDADNEDSDDITIRLLTFGTTDIKNLDNNTNVTPSGSVVPNSIIAGNVQDSRVPTLDVQLAATPSSQTYVRGITGVPLVGLSFRATGGDIRLDQIKIAAASTSGSMGSGEVTTLKLYDGATQIGDTKSLTSGTDMTATFTGLNQTITKGNTKVYTLKGNIDSNAGQDEIYYFYTTSTSAGGMTIYDSQGNSATLSGTNANNGNSVTLTVRAGGDVTVARAADDTDSEAGILLAGKEEVLGKFKFTSTNEEMSINKLQILVVSTNSATATAAAASDDVPTIKLYEGTTQVGNAAGYTVTGSGDFSGVAFIDNLGWKIPKDDNKTLTIKGVLNSIAAGADQGTDVYVSVMNQADSSTTFEAQGASAKDTTITAATGNRKVVYKTKPTLSLASATAQPTSLSAATIPVLRFKLAADANGSMSWRKIQFQVAMQNATMSAVTTSNIVIKDLSTGNNLTLTTVYSGSSASTSTAVTITGGNTGYVGAQVTTEQEISASASKEYELQLTFADPQTTAGAAKATVKLYRQETVPVNATFYGDSASGVSSSTADAARGMAPSFVWSDRSNTSHATTTADWANGVYVKPGSFESIYNTISN